MRRFAGASLLLLLFVTLPACTRRSALTSEPAPTQTSIFAGPISDDLIEQLHATQENGQITREQAIGLAELYCSQAHDAAAQPPSSNYAAELVPLDEARKRALEPRLTSDDPVWFVSMDGLWFQDPPPAAPGETQQTIRFTHCTVITGAHTGELIHLTSK